MNAPMHTDDQRLAKWYGLEKQSERSLPPAYRRGVHPVVTDQMGTVLIGVAINSETDLGVRGGQGRTARELCAPIRRSLNLWQRAWAWLVELLK